MEALNDAWLWVSGVLAGVDPLTAYVIGGLLASFLAQAMKKFFHLGDTQRVEKLVTVGAVTFVLAAGAGLTGVAELFSAWPGLYATAVAMYSSYKALADK